MTGVTGTAQLALNLTSGPQALYKAPPGRNTRQQPAPARKDTSPGTALQKVADEEWTPVLHKETGDTYWWNEHTGKTPVHTTVTSWWCLKSCRRAHCTTLQHMQPGQHRSRTMRAGQTTALGDPKPGTQMPAPVGPRTGSTVQQLGGLVAAGAGVGLVFSLFGRMF